MEYEEYEGNVAEGAFLVGKFKVTIDRDEEGMWIVECPAIPGCVSQGQTIKDTGDQYRGKRMENRVPSSSLLSTETVP